jgi:hypothetical protein
MHENWGTFVSSESHFRYDASHRAAVQLSYAPQTIARVRIICSWRRCVEATGMKWVPVISRTFLLTSIWIAHTAGLAHLCTLKYYYPHLSFLRLCYQARPDTSPSPTVQPRRFTFDPDTARYWCLQQRLLHTVRSPSRVSYCTPWRLRG